MTELVNSMTVVGISGSLALLRAYDASAFDDVVVILIEEVTTILSVNDDGGTKNMVNAVVCCTFVNVLIAWKEKHFASSYPVDHFLENQTRY